MHILDGLQAIYVIEVLSKLRPRILDFNSGVPQGRHFGPIWLFIND